MLKSNLPLAPSKNTFGLSNFNPFVAFVRVLKYLNVDILEPDDGLETHRMPTKRHFFPAPRRPQSSEMSTSCAHRLVDPTCPAPGQVRTIREVTYEIALVDRTGLSWDFRVHIKPMLYNILVIYKLKIYNLYK